MGRQIQQLTSANKCGRWRAGTGGKGDKWFPRTAYQRWVVYIHRGVIQYNCDMWQMWQPWNHFPQGLSRVHVPAARDATVVGSCGNRSDGGGLNTQVYGLMWQGRASPVALFCMRLYNHGLMGLAMHPGPEEKGFTQGLWRNLEENRGMGSYEKMSIVKGKGWAGSCKSCFYHRKIDQACILTFKYWN